MEYAMPKINVYLSDELAEAVRDAGIPVSAVCQRALEHAVARVTAIRETTTIGSTGFQGDLEGSMIRFTNRARNMVILAVDDASAAGVPIATEHLLAAILAEGGNLALSVLASMEIEPQEVGAALSARRPKTTTATGPIVESAFDDNTQEVLRLAVTEATSLGHNYIGSEHLLLALIAEPNGLAGQVLRSLGAELRLTRRAVTAALAGYAAAAKNPGGKTDIAAMLTEAIQAQLAPFVARLEQLENR
jgi:ATP-dependent Clp protease ATP-binding subunit ClpA